MDAQRHYALHPAHNGRKLTPTGADLIFPVRFEPSQPDLPAGFMNAHRCLLEKPHCISGAPDRLLLTLDALDEPMAMHADHRLKKPPYCDEKSAMRRRYL